MADPVELIGSENDVRSISDAVKAQRRQQREAATTKRRKKNKDALARIDKEAHDA